MFESSEFAVLVLVVMAGGFSSGTRLFDGVRQTIIDYGVFFVFGSFVFLGIWMFLNRDSQFLQTLLSRYWLVALFAVFVLEGALLLYFAPSESLVPVAIGMTITTDVAPATPVVYGIIIGVALIGATLGQTLVFLLAKRWGRERLISMPWFRISPKWLDRFDGWFHRWGTLAIPLSNTLLFTRGMLTIPAGLADMDIREFIVLSAAGTLVFETILALLTLGLFNLEFLGLGETISRYF